MSLLKQIIFLLIFLLLRRFTSEFIFCGKSFLFATTIIQQFRGPLDFISLIQYFNELNESTLLQLD